MPIYEYRCSCCRHEFEELVGFAEADAPRSCPACGEEGAERRISAFAVRVAGSSRGGSGAKNCGSCKKSSCTNC